MGGMGDANFQRLFDDLVRRFEAALVFDKLLNLDEYEIITAAKITVMVGQE
jgi:hypothetical protein